MSKKLNKKGFTLIELLAALVILTAIMGIAIPSISSSLERTKVKQNKTKEKILETAAELYVTDHKNSIYNFLASEEADECYISVNNLDTLEENKELGGMVIFNKKNNSFTFANTTDMSECVTNFTPSQTIYTPTCSDFEMITLTDSSNSAAMSKVLYQSYTFDDEYGFYFLSAPTTFYHNDTSALIGGYSFCEDGNDRCKAIYVIETKQGAIKQGTQMVVRARRCEIVTN